MWQVLPIFLAGCKQFVLLLGESYCKRLWCVLEMFTWLRMGGSTQRIAVLAFGRAARHAEDGAATAAGEHDALMAFHDFDARTASCFLEHEKQHLLGVLEAGFGTLSAFWV